MARGEPGKDGPRGPSLAIGSVFAASCLAALTLVAMTTRSCSGCMPRGWMMPAPVSEPFAGASGAIEELWWRDAGRARQTYVRPTTPDAPAAAAALRAALEQRGYVLTAGGAEVHELPLEARTPALEGACGVVAITGLGNATLSGASAADSEIVASDPSVAAIAACGDVALRASGIGSATIELWQMPGITPADVAATGLPTDVVLAHAEAEVLWRARGWTAGDELVREEHAASATPTWISPPGGVPSSGCRAWVGVAIGAGSAETRGSYAGLGRDYALGRSLFGATQCASTAATQTTLTDEDGDGYVVYWRPYGAGATQGGAGPTRAAALAAIVPRAGALRVVEAAEVMLPDAFEEPSAP